MRRLALPLAGMLLLAACSPALVSRSDVPGLVRDAFRSAGSTAEDVSVAQTREGRSWTATATVNGAEVGLVVDAEAGRITRIELGDSTALSREQLRQIARYESNSANDRARARRRVVTLVVVALLVVGGLLLARHFRLREEQELAETDEEL